MTRPYISTKSTCNGTSHDVNEDKSALRGAKMTNDLRKFKRTLVRVHDCIGDTESASGLVQAWEGTERYDGAVSVRVYDVVATSLFWATNRG